jgi:hypothetical protein
MPVSPQRTSPLPCNWKALKEWRCGNSIGCSTVSCTRQSPACDPFALGRPALLLHFFRCKRCLTAGNYVPLRPLSAGRHRYLGRYPTPLPLLLATCCSRLLQEPHIRHPVPRGAWSDPGGGHQTEATHDLSWAPHGC